jgi:DNA adenine methylase
MDVSIMHKHRSFLKWPGNKYRVLEHICARLPAGQRLIEPFVGSAAVFLNTQYPKYLLSDVNADLIHVYQLLQREGQQFINYAKSFFKTKNNEPEKYYKFREKFNSTQDKRLKAALFIYLNRHGYNGLCRYNRSGFFNVPFGRYCQPYFPETEMQFFHQKSQQDVTFMCADFRACLKRARRGQVVYCDPPYVPLTASANFTAYSPQPFLIEQQDHLVNTAEKLAKKGIPVLVSNHDTKDVRAAYQKAKLFYFSVSRTISCNPKRRLPAPELLALFE